MTTDEALKAYSRIVDGLEAKLAAKDAELTAARGLLVEAGHSLHLSGYKDGPGSLRARIEAFLEKKI